MKKRKNIFILILDFLISNFIIIGNSFIKCNSFSFIRNNIIFNLLLFVTLFIILFFAFNYMFNLFDKNKLDIFTNSNTKLKNFKLFKLFNDHPFAFSMIFIFVCWIPYIIAFYPAILSKDPSFQIKQFLGIPNKYSTYVNLLDPHVIITNHHPVIHTILLGSCVKLGKLIGSVNLGLFMYSMIQTVILISTFSCVIKFMNKIKINSIFRLFTMLFYALVPVFPFYAMSPVKDVIFGCFIILYVIKIYEIIMLDKLNLKNIIYITIIMLFIILFRNNGIYVVLLSFPFVLLIKKKYIQKLLPSFLIVITFNILFINFLLPIFKITPGSIREMLSVPFQQTARYVKEHKSEITKDERIKINKILDYNKLSYRYNSELSDPVKNSFNKDANKNDLKAYFNTWIKEGLKHPITYIEATINNTYGYVYPVKTNWYFYHKELKIINKDHLNYHYNYSTLKLRAVLILIGIIFPFIPLVGLTVNIAFNVWILLIAFIYLLYKKRYDKIICLVPLIIVTLFCFVSPANTYFRYALPFVFALPLTITILLKNNEACKK